MEQFIPCIDDLVDAFEPIFQPILDKYVTPDSDSGGRIGEGLGNGGGTGGFGNGGGGMSGSGSGEGGSTGGIRGGGGVIPGKSGGNAGGSKPIKSGRRRRQATMLQADDDSKLWDLEMKFRKKRSVEKSVTVLGITLPAMTDLGSRDLSKMNFDSGCRSVFSLFVEKRDIINA